MSDEEYIIRREVEEVEEDINEEPESELVFDNEFRILVLANSSISPNAEDDTSVSVEQSDMEELLVRPVRTMEDVNEFFDAFDSTIAEPNEGHIKYEVGSDGLCVVLVDDVKLKDAVVTFVQKFIDAHPEKADEETEMDNEANGDDERSTKRRR
jgi:hypothetical protein